MVTTSSSMSGGFEGRAIARIVGFTCLFGFLIGLLVLTFPLGTGVAWRVGVYQQVGDRSIVLLFALGLLIYGFWDSAQFRKLFSYASLSVGVLFLLACILVIRDGLKLQSMAVDRIGQQAEQLQTQVEEGRNNPQISANVAPEDFEQALQNISSQADTLKQNAKTSTNKASIASIGNFLVMGAGLLGLGRMGMGGTGGRAPRSSTGSSKQRRVSS